MINQNNKLEEMSQVLARMVNSDDGQAEQMRMDMGMDRKIGIRGE